MYSEMWHWLTSKRDADASEDHAALIVRWPQHENEVLSRSSKISVNFDQTVRCHMAIPHQYLVI
jgi:hypothetical protein